MTREDLPDFLAYKYIKAPITEGRRREPMILIFCWPRTLHFPDVPVFHAQTVSISGSQYGKLGIRLGRIFTEVAPTGLHQYTTGFEQAYNCGLSFSL